MRNLAAAALVVLSLQVPVAAAPPAAPAVRVTVLQDGSTFDSRSLIGKKVLVLRFQASWCKACAAQAAGLAPIKINMVTKRGVNESSIVPMARYFKGTGMTLRFIEFMDVGGATTWSMDKVVSRADMLRVLEARYGRIEPIVEASSAPADRYRLPDGAVFGMISSTTQPFCRACDRSRLTADGMWYRCLYATEGTDLGVALRGGVDREELKELIAGGWRARADRGAEVRLAMGERSPLIQVRELKRNPHLEMHTRGG